MKLLFIAKPGPRPREGGGGGGGRRRFELSGLDGALEIQDLFGQLLDAGLPVATSEFSILPPDRTRGVAICFCFFEK
jgi:hypothetical protein